MPRGPVIHPWDEEVQLWKLMFIEKERLYRIPVQYKFPDSGLLASYRDYDTRSWEALGGARITEDRVKKSKKRWLGLNFAEWSNLPGDLKTVHPNRGGPAI